MAVPIEVLTGSDEVFERLYARSYRPLVGYCRGLVGGHAEDAEDLAQEALVRAWRAWDRYAADPRFWPLVTTIARRLWIDELRRAERGAARRHVEAQYAVQRHADPLEVLEEREDARLARQALELVTPRYKRLLRLRDLEGRTYEEIARMEGTTVGNVATALRRARLSLQAAYRRVSEGLAGLIAFGWIGRLRHRMEQGAGQYAAPVAGTMMAVAMTVGATTGTPPVAAEAEVVSIAEVGGPVAAAPNADIENEVETTATTAARQADPVPVQDAAVPPVASVPKAPRPEAAVGPVGVWNTEARRDEVKHLEFIRVGPIAVYADPKTVLNDPLEPLQ